MKFFDIKSLFIVYLANVLSVHCLSACPPPNIDISPCLCVDDQTGGQISGIRCDGEQPLDLTAIFEILDANVAPENKNFNTFYANNTNIEEISENVFKDFTFENIYFENNQKLSKIDPKAFKGIEKSVKRLHICDSKLNFNSDDYSDLKLFDSLTNADILDFSSTECPPNSLLGPKCKCDLVYEPEEQNLINHKSTVISCKQIFNVSELVHTFTQLNATLRQNKRNFFRFQLQESRLTELTENLFKSISFNQILIEDCPQLSLIHKNTFNSIKPFVNKLTINGIYLGNDSKAVEDVWSAISSLTNVVRIDLVNVFNEIPNKAFKTIGPQSQRRLKYFSHSGYETNVSKGARITSIGRYAFNSLPNIQILNLQNNLIEKIDKYSFANQMSSNNQLLIRLARNKLNQNSFAVGSLAGSQRPIRLELGQAFMGCNRDVIYLEESVFSAFLDKSGNELDMGCAFTMQCDCHMKWLYDAPEHWKSKVKTGTFGDLVVPCEMDTEEGVEEVSIWDLPEEYFNCKSDWIDTKDRFELLVNNTVQNDDSETVEDTIELET